jgi:hypothetical protein
MFDKRAAAGSAEHRAENEKDKPITLEDLSEYELLTLRETINSMLPVKHLKDLNISTEIVIQYQIAKALQSQTLESNEESNKKAQVLNACAGALTSLAKMQSEYHTAERLKLIESKLIKALQNVPEKYLTEFFAFYESDLSEE